MEERQRKQSFSLSLSLSSTQGRRFTTEEWTGTRGGKESELRSTGDWFKGKAKWLTMMMHNI